MMNPGNAGRFHPNPTDGWTRDFTAERSTVKSYREYGGTSQFKGTLRGPVPPRVPC